MVIHVYTISERTVSPLLSADRSVQLTSVFVSHESYAGTNDKEHCAMDGPVLKKKIHRLRAVHIVNIPLPFEASRSYHSYPSSSVCCMTVMYYPHCEPKSYSS